MKSNCLGIKIYVELYNALDLKLEGNYIIGVVCSNSSKYYVQNITFFFVNRVNTFNNNLIAVWMNRK